MTKCFLSETEFEHLSKMYYGCNIFFSNMWGRIERRNVKSGQGEGKEPFTQMSVWSLWTAENPDLKYTHHFL